MNIRSLLAFMVLMLSSHGLCRADTWLKAEVYLIDWDTTTQTALTPERVRELAKSKQTFADKAPAIAHFLDIYSLKPDNSQQAEDARLVVDLYTDTGARVTYYASRFNLCKADSSSKRPIDAKFRKHFSELTQ